MLTVTVQNLDAGVILRCSGRIVGGEETAILCPVAAHIGRDVVLDLEEVEAIDATGIGLLIALQAAGFYLKLLNPTDPVREMLKLQRLDSIFDIRESRSADDGSDEVATEVATNDRSEAATSTPSWSVPPSTDPGLADPGLVTC